MDDLDPNHYCRRSHRSEAIARNLALFGHLAVLAHTRPLPEERREVLQGLMHLYNFNREHGRLPYQRREYLRRRNAKSPVIVIPEQRQGEPSRVDNNRGGRS
jgi:hypothetical protein